MQRFNGSKVQFILAHRAAPVPDVPVVPAIPNPRSESNREIMGANRSKRFRGSLLGVSLRTFQRFKVYALSRAWQSLVRLDH